MILLVTLLVLSQMKMLFLYIKLSNQIQEQHQDLYQLEAAALKLSRTMGNESCLRKDENINQMVDQVLNHQGCEWFDDNRQYNYLINDLGLYPCLQINNNSSHHWLLTIATASTHPLVLQLRIAEAGQKKICKGIEPRSIPAGVITWRYWANLSMPQINSLPKSYALLSS